MGFGTNLTLGAGATIGGAWAIDSTLGMMALGGVGSVYACLMGAYGVTTVLGAAFSHLTEKDEMQEVAKLRKQKEEENTTKREPEPHITGRLSSIAATSDREMSKFQNIARK